MLKRFTLLMLLILLGTVASCGHKGPTYVGNGQSQKKNDEKTTIKPTETPTTAAATTATTVKVEKLVVSKPSMPSKIDISLHVKFMTIEVCTGEWHKLLDCYLEDNNEPEEIQTIPYLDTPLDVCSVKERSINYFSTFLIIGNVNRVRLVESKRYKKVSVHIEPELRIGDKIIKEVDFAWHLRAVQTGLVTIIKRSPWEYDLTFPVVGNENQFPDLIVDIDHISSHLQNSDYALLLDIPKHDQSLNRMVFINETFDLKKFLAEIPYIQKADAPLSSFKPELGHSYISVDDCNSNVVVQSDSLQSDTPESTDSQAVSPLEFVAKDSTKQDDDPKPFIDLEAIAAATQTHFSPRHVVRVKGMVVFP